VSTALLATFAASGRAARAELRACAAERGRLKAANADLLAALRRISDGYVAALEPTEIAEHYREIARTALAKATP